MGVLDDAIRQHLELKRQHGADESELRRKEDEALGPARREAPAAQEDESVPDPVEAAAPDEPVATEPADEPVPEPDVVDGEAVEEPAYPDDSTQDFDALAAEEDRRAEPAPHVEPPDGEEDVLEETPEFLQETPEHDRLWFEQKPPRDFDFDEDD